MKAQARCFAASIALTCALPFVLDGTLWLTYLAQYHGTCGPHPTDIPEYPCSFDTYSGEFWSGWNGVGMLVVDIAVFLFAASFVGIFWLVWLASNPRGRRVADPEETTG